MDILSVVLCSLKSVGFPICFLPTVKPAPSLAGSLRHSWLDIPSGTPVGIAMGDLQCSIYSVQPTASDASELVIPGSLVGKYVLQSWS